MILRLTVCILCLLAAPSFAQTLDARALSGKYFFRHLLFTTDSGGNVSDTRSALGTITFNGSGQYSINGQQAIGQSAAVAFTGNGSYSVSPGGIVSLANPLRSTLNVNARFGAEALIGSSTETTDNTFDLFVAIPAPTTAQSSAALNGTYYVTSIELPGATASAVRDGFFTLQSNGAGLFATVNTVGHAADINNGAQFTQAIPGASYGIGADGSGTINFPLSAGQGLVSGSRNVFVSQSGNLIVGGSSPVGGQDLFIGVRAISEAATNSSLKDNYWFGGLRFEQPHAPQFTGDTGGSTSSFVGSGNAKTPGKLETARRGKQLSFQVPSDVTLANNYTIAAAGTGKIDTNAYQIGVGSGGNSFVGADINDSQGDRYLYELNLGVRIPTLTGTGVFLNPNGVANAASFASAGSPIAPGEFISLFGSGLAAETATAKPPYPPSLAGVSVAINGKAAPVYLVSEGQLNVLVPYSVGGPTGSIVVTNNGKASNTVTVPVSSAAPGVFSTDQSGTGPGAILHADFTPVNSSKPAKSRETVLIFLTGLGAVTPVVSDGTAGGSNPLSAANAGVKVFIGGFPATVGYAGLAPGFPGLYQINATVPGTLFGAGLLPLAMEASDGQAAVAFHCQTDIQVQ